MLLDATEKLLQEEGYAALSARRVAQTAGLSNHQIIYYYFATHEELLLETIRRKSEQNIKALAELLSGPNPIRAIWRYNRDPKESWFVTEFVALANRYASIKAVISVYGAQFRELERQAVERYCRERGVQLKLSPAALALLVAGVAQMISQSEEFGISVAHDELEALVDELFPDEQDPPDAAILQGVEERR